MRALCVLLLAAACADEAAPPPTGERDLPLGDPPADLKADDWGFALTCKPIPDLPALQQPKITLSLNGLTLHLVDTATGYDRVFPIGVGKIETDATSPVWGESLSYEPIDLYRRQDFALHPATNEPCKIWWTDPDTNQDSPVFAGLPFLSWSGNYGIHGPIDNFRAENGGNLRRGYVSHGCIRMEAADILEVYARTRGVATVPVHVQREPERLADGSQVDLAAKWVGAECSVDTDCAYPGGTCKLNSYGGRGFCTAACTRYCSDRAGYPTTFCVADPDNALMGMCVPKESSVNAGCRPYDHLVARTQRRFGQSWVSAKTCVPGSPGWVGDRCKTATDCRTGTTCVGAAPSHPGTCTMACSKYCADQPGWTTTFCASDSGLGAGGQCVRQCTPSSNASECPLGDECLLRSRQSDAATMRYVCIP